LSLGAHAAPERRGAPKRYATQTEFAKFYIERGGIPRGNECDVTTSAHVNARAHALAGTY